MEKGVLVQTSTNICTHYENYKISSCHVEKSIWKLATEFSIEFPAAMLKNPFGNLIATEFSVEFLQCTFPYLDERYYSKIFW